MTGSRPTRQEPTEIDAVVALAESDLRAGRLADAAGKLEAAAAHFERVIALRPNFAEAYNHLGQILWKLKKPDGAALRFEQAIALRPDYAEAYNNLGIALALTGREAPALVNFEQAIALRPDFVEAHNNLGNVLWKRDQLELAAACYRRALALKPDHVEAHNNLGYVLRNLGQLDQAAVHSKRAIALRPNYPNPYNNLGVVLAAQGRPDEAIKQLDRALALKPDFADAHINLAKVLAIQGRLDDAVARYGQARALRPESAEVEMGIAVCYLAQGDFERGWPAYESRLRLRGAVRQPDLPRWRGEPLAGRSLLLLGEQFFGDTFQFVRFARLLKARGARVVLAVQPALGRFFAAHPDLDRVCPLGAAADLPAADFYIPLLSVPGMLGTSLATIPGEVPYLHADPGLVERWRQRLANIEGFKIGLTWQAAHEPRTFDWRSAPLANFAPLARVPGVQLISLQKGLGSEQIQQVDFPVLDFGGELDEQAGPFLDTAAVIGNLDLIVTVDTSIAHLAGALGAPVFVALPRPSEWRWLCDREDSPWYPTMRLFRQTKTGAWPDVFERIAQAIEERLRQTA